MSQTIQNRYDFVFLFDVENGNPNGDPDAGNMPRIDPETSHGLVTDVCLKRKIRNYVQLAKAGEPEYSIYVREKAVLSTERSGAYDTPEVKAEKKTGAQIELARQWMCRNFFDVRTFGAVMSTKENNAGQVRGPVQLTFAKSISPIIHLDTTITRMAVETEKEAEKQGGDNRTMGKKYIVPYGLYRTEGFISAPLAEQTGFTEDDLAILFTSLINMFDLDHSAARGKMTARKLVVFRHDSKLGNAQAQDLFNRVQVRTTAGEGEPIRRFDQYEITVNDEGLPEGVTLDVKL